MSDTNQSSHDLRFDSKVGLAQRQRSRIDREMRIVASRVRSRYFWSLLAVFAVVAALLAMMLRGAQQSEQITVITAWMLIGGVIVVAVAAAFGFARQLTGGKQSTAAKIEGAFPGLGERLLTTTDLPDDKTDAPLSQHLIGETHDHFRSHHWQSVVSTGSLWASRLCGAGAFAAAVSVSMIDVRKEAVNALSQPKSIAANIEQSVTILPGDDLVERGSSLVVTAEFSDNAPESANLVIEFKDGTISETLMKQTLSDPIVGGFLSSVDQSLTYKVTSGGWSSDVYSVDVFEFPQLQRSDAVLEFPKYTKMKTRTVEDTVKVSVAEGTRVTWRLLLNKAVKSCTLTHKKGEVITCSLVSGAVVSGKVAVYEVTIIARVSDTYTLRLLDDADRKNKYPPELSIKVLPNKPPKLKLEPARDVTVSALQELPLRASVRDDYGVSKAGISYTIESEPEVTVELAKNLARNVPSSVDYTLDFESLGAKPDDLVSYYFWADDTGPDGNPRRTQSDLYFIDVRPFEEIFRAGDSPPPSQGKPSEKEKQAEELAKSQKLIITAIWNQMRIEIAGKTPAADDIETIIESQTEIIKQFSELAGKLSDPKSIELGQVVFKAMESTIGHLKSSDLPEGRESAQASFSALLKLRSREFQVTRRQQQQQQQSGGGGSQSRQQQIDDLELDDEQDRYETQQQAEQQSADQQAAAEDRQVLSRMRELAKRTEDLNEELAKLQNALEQAEILKEQEEIRRQLKRLREQQQELLRMSDELESRMRSAENSERMNEQADKLQESRENLRQATKATEQNDASAALAAGRRAETQLDELQEEFRQRAAGAFDETMRDIQDQAQELKHEQEKIGQSMREQVKEASPGLRGDEKTDAAPEQLDRQAERFQELLEKMEQTVRDADEAEPLLAQKLYDGFRKASRSQTQRQLKNAAELVRRGFMPQAEQFESEAAKGIEALQESIDDAAGAILGDATEGLRRASQRLEGLSDGAQQELGRESPQKQQQQSPKPGQQPGQPGQQPGQPGQQPGQPGQQPGQPGQQSGQPGQQPGQPGQQPGQQGQQSGQPEQQSGQPGSQSSSQSDSQEPRRDSGASNSNAATSPSQGGGPIGPITGDFREWSDQMRDVEEMVGDPELRARANTIRDRVREMRAEMNRHGSQPNWRLVDELVAQPLRELKKEVRAELLRRTATKNQLVPIDRDPVPAEFTEAVRRYYENLGSADLETDASGSPR